MSGLPRPGPGAGRQRGLWSASAVVIVIIAAMLLAPLPAGWHRAASGVGLLLGGFSLAVACGYQAVRAAERRRAQAWILGLAATGCGTAGNLWLLLADSARPTGGLSPANLCLVLALLLGLAAVLTYPLTPRRPAEVVRIVLDGVVIGSSLLFLASVFLFAQIIGPDVSLGSRALPLLVPALDVVAATAALLLFLRRSPSEGPFLGLVSIGFVLFGVSDFAFAILTVEQPFSFGTPADLGWITGYFVIAVGVFCAPHRQRPPNEPTREGSALTSTAVLLAVFLAAALVGLRPERGTLEGAPALLLLLVLLGTVGHQISLLVDNERLRGVLEQRIFERNRDLRTLTQRSDLLVNSVADGIYGVDRDGRVTFVNPVAARTLGYDPRDLLGVDAHARFHGPGPSGEPYPSPRCYISQAIAEGRVTTGEEDAYVRADGRLVPVEVTASPTTDEGVPVGAVMVFRDVTGRHEIDRLKQEFVSMVSHELKTPLTSIRGSLALLTSGTLGKLTPAAERMSGIALDSSLRLGRLIEDMLEVERIESGVLPMEVRDHAVRDLVARAVEQVAMVASAAEIALRVGPVDGRVAADGDRVQQTLINLLDNAVKFSPLGSTVNVSAHSLGSLVEFAITDAGRGIPPEKLESIFRRFEQVDSSDARDRGGAGLGLAISRGIVERHGGHIWAENNPEGGTIFRFTLPRAGQSTETDETRPASTPPGERGPDAEPLRVR